jgi:uncharacterized protein YecT (DUF1311 family)
MMGLSMKRLISGVLFVFFGCSTSLAQDSERYSRCISKANTQMAMHICANEEGLRADAELNDIYKKLLSVAADQSDAVEKIRAAERAWIAYRNAYIEAMYPAKDKQREYGSSYQMEVDLLRAKLTRQQIGALRDLLKQYDGSPR